MQKQGRGAACPTERSRRCLTVRSRRCGRLPLIRINADVNRMLPDGGASVTSKYINRKKSMLKYSESAHKAGSRLFRQA